MKLGLPKFSDYMRFATHPQRMVTSSMRVQVPTQPPKKLEPSKITTGIKKLLSTYWIHPTQDQFLVEQPKQPKMAVANYFESQGFLVPKRFSTFVEALHSGYDFVIRSEHPQEYNGVSDLLHSFVVDQQLIQACFNRDFSAYEDHSQFYKSFYDALCALIHDEIDERTFWHRIAKMPYSKVSIFCENKGISEAEFYKDVSFTYWQKIPGQNLMIVEDDSVPGRFHVLNTEIPAPDNNETKSAGKKIPRTYYYTYQEGRIWNELKNAEIDERHIEHAKALAKLYQRARRLPRFSLNHCPIMELQVDHDGQIYLLQYHRSRNRDNGTNIELLKPPKYDGVIEASFVRGKTPSDEPVEMKLLVGVAYSHVERGIIVFDRTLATLARFLGAKNEELVLLGTAKLDHYNPLDYLSFRMLGAHDFFTDLFKPRMSIVVDYREKETLTDVDQDIIEAAKQQVTETGKDVPVYITISVVSDGTRAYVFRK